MDICVFGDSITEGFFDDIGGGWVNRLKGYLENKNSDYQVINLGISGNTSADLLNRIESDLKPLNPEIIVFSIGINDSQFQHESKHSKVPLEQYKENLAKLYKIALTHTPNVIFLGLTDIDEAKLTPIPWHTVASYFEADKNIYNEAVKEFCNQNNLKYIPMNGIISKTDVPDGAHPNAEGHEKIFEVVKDEII